MHTINGFHFEELRALDTFKVLTGPALAMSYNFQPTRVRKPSSQLISALVRKSNSVTAGPFKRGRGEGLQINFFIDGQNVMKIYMWLCFLTKSSDKVIRFDLLLTDQKLRRET